MPWPPGSEPWRPVVSSWSAIARARVRILGEVYEAGALAANAMVRRRARRPREALRSAAWSGIE